MLPKTAGVIPQWCITPIPVELLPVTSTTSLLMLTSITTLSIIIVPELAIPAETYPE